MTVEMVTRTIQLILAPVVMISACSITLTGLLNHYNEINHRVRAMTHERIDLLRSTGQRLAAAFAAADEFTRERLDQIDQQLPVLLHRHMLIRNAMLSIYSAILVFIVNMFVIALAAISQTDWLSSVTLICFLIGMIVLFAGVLFVVFEVHLSQRAIEYETRRVLQLGRETNH